MNIQLKPATEADYDFLYNLMVATMKEYVTAIWGWDEKWQQDHFREQFESAGWQVIVATGRAAGGVAIEKRPSETFIRNIYILPSCQRQGIGTAVISRILAKAAECGAAVALNVLVSNPSARRLYERLGFRMIEETKERCFMRHENSRPVSGLPTLLK